MAKKKTGLTTPVIRTGKGKLRIPIFGGVATSQQIDKKTSETIRNKHKTIHDDGSVTFDNELIGYDMFRESLINIEGYTDEEGTELKLDDEFKENIINYNPEFFSEYITATRLGFLKREDVITKN